MDWTKPWFSVLPSFDRNFADSGDEGRVVRLLGTGDLDRKMFLCRVALRKGFAQEEDGDNTAIHEYVHLVDKMYGPVDGISKVIIRRQYVLPWLETTNIPYEKMNYQNHHL